MYILLYLSYTKYDTVANARRCWRDSIRLEILIYYFFSKKGENVFFNDIVYKSDEYNMVVGLLDGLYMIIPLLYHTHKISILYGFDWCRLPIIKCILMDIFSMVIHITLHPPLVCDS